MKRKKKEEKIERELGKGSVKSRAKRIRMLVKKNHAFFKDKQALVDFKEPIAMLKRVGGTVEWYEDVSKGAFEFEHSDKTRREIYIDPSAQLTFDYGKRKFKGYWLDEDSPVALPSTPRVTAETINGIVEKATMDMKKLNTRRQELQIKTLKTIGWFLLGGILIYILYQTHAFEKLIGLVTGSPYVDPATIQQGATNIAGAVQNNSLAITSG